MSTNDALSPELIRILKIFGVLSVGLVLILSIFNDRKANNTGNLDEFFVSDASRIYFKNLRQHSYELERHPDAKMDIFRHENRTTDTTQPVLNVAIIINRVKDAAYLYLEPQGGLENENPLTIRWHKESGKSGEYIFFQGDRFSHFRFMQNMFPLSIHEEKLIFEAKLNQEWVPILTSADEMEALKITCVDYFRLIDKK